MGVNEDVLNEIFEERAQYLVNVEVVMLGMYDDEISGKTMDFRKKRLLILDLEIWYRRSELLTSFSKARNIRHLFN